MSKKIAIVCGARPNFMKVAPLCKTLKEKCVEYCLINTGQHFDFEMSQAFFDEFNIKPDYNLSPSKISAIKQFSDIICDLERIYQKEKIDLVVVVGDVVVAVVVVVGGVVIIVVGGVFITWLIGFFMISLEDMNVLGLVGFKTLTAELGISAIASVVSTIEAEVATTDEDSSLIVTSWTDSVSSWITSSSSTLSGGVASTGLFCIVSTLNIILGIGLK